jgi:hypothetical protein
MFSDSVDLNLKLQLATNGPSKSSKVPLRSVIKSLLRAHWREEDMFQVPLLLYTVLKIDSERSVLNKDMDEELVHRVRRVHSQLIQTLIYYTHCSCGDHRSNN